MALDEVATGPKINPEVPERLAPNDPQVDNDEGPYRGRDECVSCSWACSPPATDNDADEDHGDTDGRQDCRSFDADADGFVRSEGAGYVVTSPDGKFVYVRNMGGAGIRIFSRDLLTGDLTPATPPFVANG